MPTVLRLPLVSAALEPQNSRCSLPGDSDWEKISIVMSKSKSSMRAGTARVDGAHAHVDADLLESLLEGQREALEPRLAQQHFEG